MGQLESPTKRAALHTCLLGLHKPKSRSNSLSGGTENPETFLTPHRKRRESRLNA